MLKVCSYSSAVEHSLGKGEVLSSILNMSSIYCSIFYISFAEFSYSLYIAEHLYRNNNILKITKKDSVVNKYSKVTLRCCLFRAVSYYLILIDMYIQNMNEKIECGQKDTVY